MAEGADGQPYEAMAHQLARITFASRAYRDGHAVFPDERAEPRPTWGDGMSGVVPGRPRPRHRLGTRALPPGRLET